MFKGLGDMAGLLKQAQEMQGKVRQMQSELEQLRVTGTAGAGMVTVEATGHQQVLSIQIDPSLLNDPDADMISELTVAAVNDALSKAKEASQERMSQLTGGLDMSSFGGLLGGMGGGN
ncbi:YbaB/EbfC family nucleoid-associated protein [Calycomorphotria hydatis]|uniref:Nucleoid-associated protein V22_13980 n=1 Tax=Calycomorphotria hydatis TaxID=2528027 RepID=A0A517T727_9PLAN|nr:YbaB/EbfC family nucleoid-associated protein [Calycomorphotria hydatis]QDT64167.1 Nucleoid-associated protein [Calycomorphotria hydatis]